MKLVLAIVRAVKVELVTEALARVIGETARTGRYGDGMAFVLPVERALRIASLAEGEAAI
jgi:nitrogen regulatory protein PII